MKSVAMEDVHVGEQVRVKATHSRGVVQEIDPALHVALVEFPASGAERWLLLDEIEVLVPWYMRGRMRER